MLPVVGEDEFFDSSVFPVFGLGRSPYKENGIYRVLKATLCLGSLRVSISESNLYTYFKHVYTSYAALHT